MKITSQQYGLKKRLNKYTFWVSIFPMLFLLVAGSSFSYIQLKSDAYNKLDVVRGVRKELVLERFSRLFADARILAEDNHILEFGKYLVSAPVEEMKKVQEQIKSGKFIPVTYEQNTIRHLHAFLATDKFKDIYFIRDRDLRICMSFLNRDAIGLHAETAGSHYESLFAAYKKTVSRRNIYVGDMTKYPPFGKSVVFTGVPVVVNGQVLGAYLLITSSTDITKIISDYAGLGETGETYLVGEDGYFRSDSRFWPNAALNEKSFSAAVDKAMKIQHNVEILKDYRNISVLSAYSYVGLNEHLGLEYDWIIFSEVDALEAFQHLIILVAFMSAIILVFIFISLYFGKRYADEITNPLTSLAKASRKISNGNLDIELPEYMGYQEITQFTAAFKNMISNFQKINEQMKELSLGNTVIDFGDDPDHPIICAMMEIAKTLNDFSQKARAVASGDYEVVFNPRSEKDTLGISLKQMTQSLFQKNRDLLAREWLKTARTKTAEIGQNSAELENLAFQFLEYLVPYTGAKAGLLYVKDEEQANVQWRLAATYGIPENYYPKKTIRVDDGIDGSFSRSFINGKNTPLVVENLGENFLSFGSGFGEFVPRNLLLAPLFTGTEKTGLLEFVFGENVESRVLDLVNEVSDIVSASIDNSLENKKIKHLLEKTRNQAEELQAQQEELRAINEEMTEKNIALEKQQKDILEKNDQLRSVSHDLEVKAEELEKASYYKSEFLANMSHELRTPLNSLLLLANKLKRNKDNNLSEKQVESLKIISKSGNTLLGLINGLLDLAKIEAGRMEVSLAPTGFKVISEEIESTFDEEVREKKLDFTVSIDPELPDEIQTDPPKMLQILKNLVSNALKFTDKGFVKVSFELKNIDQKKYVLLRVKDTGIGIPQDKISQVFEAFRQVDGSTARVYGGTGLGLTITREMTRQLGGFLEVDSKENSGTEFRIFLPFDQKAAEGGPSPPKKDNTTGAEKIPLRNNASGKNRQRTILVIEDDLDFSRTLMDICEEKGFRCIHSPLGRGGLEIANNEPVDAIILDLNLPDIDGEEVIDNLKMSSATKHIPVQILSGSSKEKALLQKGAMGYLKKPASEDAISKALRSIESILNAPVARVLVLGTDSHMQNQLSEKFDHPDLVEFADDHSQVMEKISRNSYSCMVLDYDIVGIDVFAFLEQIHAMTAGRLPVIVYTKHELTEDELLRLKELSEDVIINTSESLNRLYSEVKLFLHAVKTADTPDVKNLHKLENSLAGKRVMIIDDDMRSLFALAEELEEEQMIVTKVPGGKKAIAMLSESNGFDIVITDIMMPEMDGYETIREIRRLDRHRDIPIIALTAKAMKEDRNLCIVAGANDYLSKPIDRSKILSMLNIWLNRRNTHG